jgi:hypothetical protein
MVAAALVLVVIVLLLTLRLGRRRTVAETERVPACAGLATAE